MVRLLTAVVLVSALWRGSAVQTTAIVSDGVGNERKPLVRHQGTTESLAHLSPKGEMVNGEKQTSSSSATTTSDCQDSYVTGDYCSQYNTDGTCHTWTDGNVANSECTTPSEEELILNHDACQEAVLAAVNAGITDATYGCMSSACATYTGTASPGTMNADSIYKEHYPMGCFKSANSNVFYFNPVGAKPNPLEHNWTTVAGRGGFPICTRHRYWNGSTSTATPPATTCHNQYYIAIDQKGTDPVDLTHSEGIDNCRTAGQCLTYSMVDMFQVGDPPPPRANPNGNTFEPLDPRPTWAREYNYMPKGCFIRETDGNMYWNAPQTLDPSDPGCTTNCGTYATGAEVPMCMAARWYGGNQGITVNGNVISR